MKKPSKFNSFFEKFKKPVIAVYPIVIIVFIPTLLIINTLWNLQTFNRDANYIIRHQAVSIADSIKPQIENLSNDPLVFSVLLTQIVKNNEDIVSITIYQKENGKLIPFSMTDELDAQNGVDLELNKFADSLSQPIAALNYDPRRLMNVWNVDVPIQNDSGNYLMQLKVSTATVQTLIDRTTRDSVIILFILITITIILLLNHFNFYIRSIRTSQLEELDKLKDEFISIATHELRTPVTALKGYISIAEDKFSLEEKEKTKEERGMIQSIIHDLEGLINDLLDVSRIEQGRFTLTNEPLQVNDIIQKVVAILKPNAQEKNLELEFSPGTLPQIVSDTQRIQQIATNLIGNAIKYSLKGKVAITTSLEEKFIKITVRDTGIGIPADQMKLLFTKFHRVKDSQTFEVRGTGLGLWVTKQIVELLGGKITVESIYGTGSSFSFTIPVISPQTSSS